MGWEGGEGQRRWGRRRTFAKSVLPVPGGPCNNKWRNGARLRLVLNVAVATRRSRSSSRGSRTTPSSASLPSALPSRMPRARRAVGIGARSASRSDVRDVSRTREGLPRRAWRNMLVDFACGQDNHRPTPKQWHAPRCTAPPPRSKPAARARTIALGHTATLKATRGGRRSHPCAVHAQRDGGDETNCSGHSLAVDEELAHARTKRLRR